MNIKVLIATHKKYLMPMDDVYLPVRVGNALANDDFGYQPDNEGENISSKNPYYCELTAIYWAWKNDKNSDFIGFFHYRRYLSFKKDITKKPNVWGVIEEDHFSESFIDKYGYTRKDILNQLSESDIVLPQKRDITAMPGMGANMREQFSSNHSLHKKDLDIMLEVLHEKYPEFDDYADKYLAGKYTYLNNIFIMKRHIFDKYCEWLFDILFECDKRIDYSDYSTEAIRTPGHLAERLLNIYILYLKANTEYRINELPTIYINKTDPFAEIKPAFNKNNIAIALSADDFYSPYLATVIESIRENSSVNYNYDIMVMNKNISPKNQRKIKSIVDSNSNFAIRFIDISRYEEKFKGLFLRGHFTIETWFRLIMPEIMPNYKKVLYLDSDLVVNSDIAELYNTDISGFLLAACHDADTAGLYNGFEPNKKEYMDNVLKIVNPFDYFQAGVILFNLDEFRKQLNVDETLKYASSYDWQLLDQDVLNYLAQGKVKYVDMAWNVMYDWLDIRRKNIIALAPKKLQDQYDTAHASPKILHYAGPDKPWNDPTVDYAELFWRYCRNSGYYEECLFRSLANKPTTNNQKVKNIIKSGAKTVFPEGTKRGEAIRRLYAKIK